MAASVILAAVRYLVKVSIAICIPNLNAYSKMAASARLMYSLQQSWNFSNVLSVRSRSSFPSSRDALPYSRGVPSSPLSCFCCHLAVLCFRAIVLLLGCSCVAPPVSTTTYQRREKVQHFFKNKSNFFHGRTL